MEARRPKRPPWKHPKRGKAARQLADSKRRGDLAGRCSSTRAAVELLSVCTECPVRTECLRDALSAPFTPIGCWGGTLTTEREGLFDRPTVAGDPEGGASLPESYIAPEEVAAAIQLFEETLEARLEGWRAKAAKSRPGGQWLDVVRGRARRWYAAGDSVQEGFGGTRRSLAWRPGRP